MRCPVHPISEVFPTPERSWRIMGPVRLGFLSGDGQGRSASVPLLRKRSVSRPRAIACASRAFAASLSRLRSLRVLLFKRREEELNKRKPSQRRAADQSSRHTPVCRPVLFGSASRAFAASLSRLRSLRVLLFKRREEELNKRKPSQRRAADQSSRHTPVCRPVLGG